MNADCTVLVASCDAYADLLAPFAALKRKFWPDCPFETVLVTEQTPTIEGEREAAKPAFDRVIACGKGMNWASRLVQALDQITTPSVLMLCDDYFLEAPVDTANLLRRLEQFKDAAALNLRLVPNPRHGLPRADGLMEYPKNTAYCISTLSGFWDRAFLQKLARPVSSIWEFERYGSFSVGEETRPILATCEREFPFVDAVHKGCWERFGVAVCEANQIVIDLTKRGLPPMSTRLKEMFKAFVFAVVPNTLIVRIQNALGLGARERRS